ncbi:hypothetical protein BpHYR1_051981, partial [Brachionus plicatilis]
NELLPAKYESGIKLLNPKNLDCSILSQVDSRVMINNKIFHTFDYDQRYMSMDNHSIEFLGINQNKIKYGMV